MPAKLTHADFLARIVVLPNGCWEYTGPRNPVSGYGTFGRRAYAHQYAYEYFKGPIPVGMEPDHTCRFKACVRPDHLEAVTHLVNCQRGRMRRLETCRKGHSYTPATLRTRLRMCKQVAYEERRCLICHRERSRQFRNRQKVA